MKIRSFFLFFLLSAGVVFGNDCPYYVIDGTYEDNSVIKLWYTVLGLLDEYDKGACSGFEIIFNCDGKHFDSKRGPNWWEYYFAFHAVGSEEHHVKVRVPRYKRSIIRFKTVCTMPFERGHYLINKYLLVQPSIQSRVDEIKHDYWHQDVPMVGVYYQNPIMPGAQKEWEPLSLCNRVKEELKNIGACTICLFTDIKGFTDIFKEQFDLQCIAHDDHNQNRSAAERGEHELLTMLLLAQCDAVIAPGSYQARAAKMINPKLKLIELDTIPYARM